MNLVCNSTIVFPSTLPSAAAPGQSSGARAPALRTESPWLANLRLSSGQREDDNAWRAVTTRRTLLSREAIVARIRQQVDRSLLPAPEQPDAAAVAASAVNLGRVMLDSMRSLFASMPTLRIGPAGAEAAPTTGRPAADRVSYFIKRFEKKFDIRKTPALAGNADLSGVTVVIGGNGDPRGSDAMPVLDHLRRKNGDRLMIEGRSQSVRWNRSTCEGFNAGLRANCLQIEAGCTASESYYDAVDTYQLAADKGCAFILGTLSVFRPDIKVELPGNIDQCLETSALYADIAASFKPEGVQHHEMQIAQALKRLKEVNGQTTTARQAHMLERIREPIAKGAARFVIVNTDFLADLAPTLLSEGKVILMMPVERASSSGRYRMPYATHSPEHEEL